MENVVIDMSNTCLTRKNSMHWHVEDGVKIEVLIMDNDLFVYEGLLNNQIYQPNELSQRLIKVVSSMIGTDMKKPMRGGGYWHDPEQLKTTKRFEYDPEIRVLGFGLRIVMEDFE